ncbi:hypothetical protein [Gimesia algae]|nr:hypothetical protein [Gimesia algae]
MRFQEAPPFPRRPRCFSGTMPLSPPFKANSGRNVVKILPLKGLKGMV